MRGRATGVALPALVVLVLVAVVAIAATGSTSGGDGETRPPSDTLLDAFFSLGLVAVALGGILLVYGLMQRQDIAREIASGRYRRTGLLSFLGFFVLFTAFSYWRLSEWERPPAEELQELPFPGATPQPPTTTEPAVPAAYEPSISWIPIAVVVGLLLAAAAAYVVSERRGRGGSREQLVEELAAVLDETLDDLRAMADPRRAIIAAYARLERVLGANGAPRGRSETTDEYVARVLRELDLGSGAVERLTALYTRAKFSQHDVDTAMKEEAIAALEQARDELRPGRETPALEPALGARR
jgi:hypothetical protein